MNLKVGKITAHVRGKIVMIHDGKHGVVLTVANIHRISKILAKKLHQNRDTTPRYKVGEVYELQSGKFSIWYGISFVGSYKSRAEAEAFWAKKNAAA